MADWTEDPFDSIFRDFFGQTRPRKRENIVRTEEEDRFMDFIESDDKAFIIVELPGFEEEDISISVKEDSIQIVAKKKNNDQVREYLTQKLSQGVRIRKTLPEFVNAKKHDHTFSNGVLEISFNKQ